MAKRKSYPRTTTVSKGFVFAVGTRHLKMVSDCLNHISQGQYQPAADILNEIKGLYPHSGPIMSHSFQMMCNRRPFDYDLSTFTDDEWDDMAKSFAPAQSYTTLLQVFALWSSIANDRNGAF